MKEAWEIKSKQQMFRHQYGISITKEQAEKILSFEEQNAHFSFKHPLSRWESADLEWATFKDILDDTQFREYEVGWDASRSEYIEELKQNDKSDECLKRLDRAQRFLDLHRSLFTSRFKSVVIHYNLSADLPKLQYLRQEFDRFLLEERRAILARHFRENRTYAPNALKIQLLRWELNHYFPDYPAFEREMDAPTRPIADFLKTQTYIIKDEARKVLEGIREELNAFNQAEKKKIGKINGWHVTIFPEADEATVKMQLDMSLFLMNASPTSLWP